VSSSNKTPLAALESQIAALQKELGISASYAAAHKLKPCMECADLVSIGKDIFDRNQRLTPGAARAWADMKSAATIDAVELHIIRKKLLAGQEIKRILEVSAAPGYSEHHTGRALDISTPGYQPLEEEFENSDAFQWLQTSAARFGFKMSFPRNNPHQLAYEPWHWCWSAGSSDLLKV
jgi:D-alanyl-D-alanine carboxypeptidase